METNSNSLENKLKLSNFGLINIDKSQWIKPYRLKYSQNEKERTWDGLVSHSSVSCVIYNKSRNCIVLVKQFRPVVYISQILESQEFNQNDIQNSLNKIDWSKTNTADAFTYELCAGLCDKNISLEETVKEEILEECGYEVEAKNIYKISACRAGVGLNGSSHTIFYTEVTDEMKVHEGGGNMHEGEFIEVLELECSKISELLYDFKKEKTASLLFGLTWFLHEKDVFMKQKSI
jgi:UDP-sugar diphosphatase